MTRKYVMESHTWQYKSITLFTSEPSGKQLFSFIKWASAKSRSDKLQSFNIKCGLFYIQIFRFYIHIIDLINAS